MKTFKIESSFLFSDEANTELLYGYTVRLPGSSDQESFDSMVQEYNYGLIVKNLPMDQIGDLTRWISGNASEAQLIDIVRVRLGNVGAFVFIRYPDGSTPSVAADLLMQVYAESIQKHEYVCRLVSVAPVEEAQWPTFEVVADGFYPGEKRAILISGEVLIAGEPQNALLGKMGQTDDVVRVDRQGVLTDSVEFGPIAGEDITWPTEYELKIIGHYSGCEIVETVEGAGSSGTS